MNIFGILGALLICGVWLEFLRRLDVFEPEKWKYSIMATSLGALFTFFLMIVISLPVIRDIQTNGDPIHDLLFYIFRVGLLEEVVKIIPLFIMLSITKEIDEPYDFLKFAMCSALGFATLENISYFNEHGSEIIDKRAYISVVGHLSFTCCFAYGFIRKQMFGTGNQWVNIFLFGFIAIVLHGLFDFFISSDGLFIFFVLLAYFLVIMLRNMMNTALNFSPFFDQVHSSKIQLAFIWLLRGLISVFVFAFFAIAIEKGMEEAFAFLFGNIILSGTLIFLLPGKLSKFVLEKKTTKI
jgi:RsiW-degrading membrane proteinase PrsW (M82 family)